MAWPPRRPSNPASVLLLAFCCASLILLPALHAASDPLSDPPKSPAQDLSAALRNLSRASCPGGNDYILSVMGDNVTVLSPGYPPLHLDEPDHILSFFNSSFLPCGVQFTMLDLASGKGNPLSDPNDPCPPIVGDPAKPQYAVTRLMYLAYAPVDIGKILALWTLAQPESDLADPPKGGSAPWKLSVIGWSSDLPAATKNSEPESDPEEISLLSSAANSRARRSAEFPRSVGKKKKCPRLSDKPKVSAWAGVTQALQDFSGNVSAGDAETAAQCFTVDPHPFILMEPNRPPEEFPSRADQEYYVQQFLGMDVSWRVLSAWEIKAKSVALSSPGPLRSSKTYSAFVIGSLKASSNGTVVQYGSMLSFWEANYASKGKSKGLRYAMRWQFFALAAIPPTTAES